MKIFLILRNMLGLEKKSHHHWNWIVSMRETLLVTKRVLSEDQKQQVRKPTQILFEYR